MVFHSLARLLRGNISTKKSVSDHNKMGAFMWSCSTAFMFLLVVSFTEQIFIYGDPSKGQTGTRFDDDDIDFGNQQDFSGDRDQLEVEGERAVNVNDIIEIHEALRDLREDINSLKQQNRTSKCDRALCNVSQSIDLEDLLEDSHVLKSLRREVGHLLSGVLEQLHTQKTALKKMSKDLAGTVSILIRKINSVETELTENFERQYEQTQDDIASVNETWYEHRKDILDKYTKFSEELGDIQADVSKTANDLNDMKSLSADLNILKLAVRDDIKKYGNSVYRYNAHAMSWKEAQKECEKENNFHLAEIEDVNELSFVRKLVGSNKAWLGGTDAEVEGRWRWQTSGKGVSASLWRSGEPNDADGGEDCLHCYGTEKNGLNDAPCTMLWHFVCEMEI